MALCTVLPARDPGEAVDLASDSPTLCVEVRADYMEAGPEAALRAVEELSSGGYRVVATLRLASEGGAYRGGGEDQAAFAGEALDRGAWMADVSLETIEAYGVPGRGSRIIASMHPDRPPSPGEVLGALEACGSCVVKVASGWRGPGDLSSIVSFNALAPGRIASYPLGRSPEVLLARALALIMGAPVVYGVHPRASERMPSTPSVSEVMAVLGAAGGVCWR